MKQIEFMYELWKRNLLEKHVTVPLSNETVIRVCDNNCEACYESSGMFEICRNADSDVSTYVDEYTYNEFFETYPEAAITM